jgi:hypothetical protein
VVRFDQGSAKWLQDLQLIPAWVGPDEAGMSLEMLVTSRDAIPIKYSIRLWELWICWNGVWLSQGQRLIVARSIGRYQYSFAFTSFPNRYPAHLSWAKYDLSGTLIKRHAR